MKLSDIVHIRYLQGSLQRIAGEINTFLEEKHLAHEDIPPGVSELFAPPYLARPINEEYLTQLKRELSSTSKQARDVINYVIFYLVQKDFLHTFKGSVKEYAKRIQEEDGKFPEPVLEPSCDPRYYTLLNALAFYQEGYLFQPQHRNIFPGVPYYQARKLQDNLAFTLNIERIAGYFKPGDNYLGIDLTQPLHPIMLAEKEPLKLTKGIKDGREYFPFKRVKKLYDGGMGNIVYMATNGKKIIFMRGVSDLPYTESVLASKIASFISHTHFSSERRFSNYLVGSRRLSAYAASLGHPRIHKMASSYRKKGGVLKGAGIIEEVCNFIGEDDPNIENFGVSSGHLSQSLLSKIDFDCCSLTKKLTDETYEFNVLTGSDISFYRKSKIATLPDTFIDEKLWARLKLSLMSDELFYALSLKAFIPQNIKEQEQTLKEISSRRDIALRLFISHPSASQFLEKNPTIFESLKLEIFAYIDKHFDADSHKMLKKSIEAQIDKTQRVITASQVKSTEPCQPKSSTTKPRFFADKPPAKVTSGTTLSYEP